jgi:hypothetical protein
MPVQNNQPKRSVVAVAGDASATTEAPTPFHELGNRLNVFATAILGLVVDLLFVALWIVIHQLAEYFYHWLGELPGMDGVLALTVKYLLTGSTLIVVGAYVVRDVHLAIRRIWGSS